MRIQDVSIVKFLQVAGGILQVFLKLPGNPKPERKGCYIGLFYKPEARFLTVSQLGDFSEPDFARRCYGYCQEKALRLAAHIGHISSWQSRSEEAEKYGGAITAPTYSLSLPVGKDLILSVSGLPEYGNEALVLTLGVNYHWLNIGDVDEIIAISQNELAHSLIRACGNDFCQ